MSARGSMGRQWPIEKALSTPSSDNRTGRELGPARDIMDAKRQREHYASLRDDIRANGIRKPLVFHSDAKMLADGHTRLAAAQELGLTHVPVRSMNTDAFWRYKDRRDRGLE